MGAAVPITRLDLTAQELRRAAGAEKDGAAARRILALALVLDGVDRKTAAQTAAWTGRPCGIGCIVTMPRGCQGLAIVNRRAAARS